MQVVGAGVGAKLIVGLGLGQFEVQPPPHSQHMSAAVKSESSFQVGQYEGEYDGEDAQESP